MFTRHVVCLPNTCNVYLTRVVFIVCVKINTRAEPLKSLIYPYCRLLIYYMHYLADFYARFLVYFCFGIFKLVLVSGA